MLNPFVSTRVFRGGPLGATTISVVAHTALVVIAVAPSGTFRSNTRPVRDPWFEPERVHLVMVPLRTTARDINKHAARDHDRNPPTVKSRNARAAGAARLIFTTFDPAALAIPEIALELPEVDLRPKINDSLDFPRTSLADLIGQVLGARHPNPIDGVYTSESVDKVMSPLGRNPRPLYPPSLAAAGIEATFVVRFVVDTTGLVKAQSVDVRGSAHPYFVDAVRRALLRSHYLPAEVDGRRVPQLVSQEFAFRMAR